MDNDVWTYLCWRLRSCCKVKERNVWRVKLVYNSDLSISPFVQKTQLEMIGIRSQVQLKLMSTVLGATFGIGIKKQLLKVNRKKKNKERTYLVVIPSRELVHYQLMLMIVK